MQGLPVFVRVQRQDESLDQSIAALKQAVINKGSCRLLVVATYFDWLPRQVATDVIVIPSTTLALQEYLEGNRQAD